MAYLAVDRYGRVYTTSGDRDDGRGFGRYPSPQGQTDVTLGAVYLKAQAKRSQDILRARQDQDELNRRDAVARQQRKARQLMGNWQSAVRTAFMRHPAVNEAALKKAIQMGCNPETSGQMAGKLSANGQTGWNGMTYDQKVIHNEVTGMGYNVTRPADPQLIRNHFMDKQLENALRIKASQRK